MTLGGGKNMLRWGRERIRYRRGEEKSVRHVEERRETSYPEEASCCPEKKSKRKSVSSNRKEISSAGGGLEKKGKCRRPSRRQTRVEK